MSLKRKKVEIINTTNKYLDDARKAVSCQELSEHVTDYRFIAAHFRASATETSLKDSKDGKNKFGKNNKSNNSLVNSGGISEGQEIVFGFRPEHVDIKTSASEDAIKLKVKLEIMHSWVIHFWNFHQK